MRRLQLSLKLENMFAADEPLVLLVWTEEGFCTACRDVVQQPDETEIRALMKQVGSTAMTEYRRDGVTNAGICDLLMRHREAVNREVSVPALLLSRVLRCQERDLENMPGQAWEAGAGRPASLTAVLDDVHSLMNRLEA